MAKAPSSTDPIMAPAIRLRGMVHAAPRPADHDVDGINTMMHGNAIWHAVGTGKASKEEASRALLDPTAMGFVTRSGKYLTRREAAAHVLATNQFRIKNPKDSQLQQLKQRLQRQIDTGHPETSLDSFDIDFMAKGGYTFEKVTDERSALHHDLKIRMTEQGSGKAVLAKLSRHHNHPEGQWEMESVMRPVGQQAPRPLTGLGGWTDPGNANTIGVAGIRALARHLKDTYGVTKLTGARISGARRNAPVVKQYVNVNLTKAQAQFTEIEHIKDPEFTGLTVRVMHPDGKQGADLHLMRQHDHPEGHWHIMNVDPVDTTLSIRGHTHSRAFANRLGTSIIRQTARHLKNTYGITSVRGFRVSGSRFGGQPDDHASIEQRDSQPVSVTLGKGLKTSIGRDVPDLDTATTVGGQRGSNPGRMVSHKGQRWYVKTYEHPEQAYGEKLANEVYRASGINAPRTAVLQHGGKHHLASKMIEGFQNFSQAPMTPGHAKQLTNGFAADVLLANWDVAGLAQDNVGHINHRATRIDQGGALLSRATSGLKSPQSLQGISEVERYAAPRSTYHAILATAGTNPDRLEQSGALRKQVQTLSGVRDAHGGWHKFVDRHIPSASPELRQRFASLLTERHAALESRFAPPVSVKLGKAFQGLAERLEKARVTPVFRATSTPPDASGRMTFRDNPLLGVTYFANTPEGASGAALTNAHDTRSDKWPRHVAATAITREHRIYGHNMPRLVPESRVQARLAHFDRVAARAPHEGIGNIIRHLASREANRAHKVVTDAQGNKYRKYKEAHLPLFFANLDGHKAHYSDNGPVPSNSEEWRAMKDSHPAHAKMRSVFQMALHHMGYHGTAVTDEGGSWNEYVRPAGDRGPRNQGSIALFPKVASGLHATARAPKDNEKPDLQERINERRPGGFVRKQGFVSRVMSTLFGKS